MSVLESFFRNDLLISFLRQYLRAEDVYACTLVSKQWHDQFEPYIWSTVELTHPAMIKNHSFPRPLRAAFSTQGDKIKALLTDDSANPSKIAEHCHNLTDFCAVTDRYSVENKDQESDAILKILDLNPKLTRLRLEGLQFSEGDLGSGLAVALTSLEHLAYFTLICAKECTISIANLQLILASCPINLQELTLSIPSPPAKEEAPNTNNNNNNNNDNAAANNDNANDADAEANPNGVAAAAAEATAAAAVAAAAVVEPPNPSLERLLNLQKEIEISTRNPMPFLKTLWFQGDFRDDDKPLLIPFIARCSNLETLIVPMVLEEPSDVLATTIRKYCPKLRNLEIGPTNFSDEYVAGLISSAARLEQLTLHHIPHLQASSAIAIAQHADSLQRLVLDYDTRIQSVDIQTILTSCKALQVFQIRVDNISHKSPRLEIKDLVSAPWTALKLRELELVIGSDFGDQDDVVATVEGEVSADESDSSASSSSDFSNVATTSGDTTITATTSEDATIVTATTSSDTTSTASTSADSSTLSASTATVSTTIAEESKEKQECKDEDIKDLELTIKNMKIQEEEVLPVSKVVVPPVITKAVVDRAAMVEQVYKQLGSLTQLYSLTLGWVPVTSSATTTTTTTTTTDTAEPTTTTTSSSTSASENSTETAALDFTLASGLGHLKTMTRLAELDLSLMLQHKVGQDEIQWMHETWPRWYLFYGYVPRESTFEPYQFVRDAGSQEGMEHIRWLKEKRPDMKLR
ncbi:hypothetical protein EC957_005405 [Mortierella hygrophila]|uniref:F-box domain-containing protein n=1 Tax=Mortierella hygrophila TaxID=979708 RepID=A0A9P6JZL4_9FUNG|nr:hypothetical protein EC957_005405 [Mortierella hygrophila]